MTGRQLGYGAGYDTPGYTKGAGRGYGRGFFGRGRRFFARGGGSGRGVNQGYYADSPELPARSEANQNTVTELKADVQSLKSSLKTILDRLDNLTSKGGS
jgi:hypothetical protein